MIESEFNRFIVDICYLLKLDPPVISNTLGYYKTFRQSETHKYSIQVIVSACIFLSCKVNEDERRIRDILNTCFFMTHSFRVLNNQQQSEQINYVYLYRLKNRINEQMGEFIPNFSLQQYKELKGEILEAEQHLLRILNYDVQNHYNEKYVMLLKLVKGKSIESTAYGLFNDSFIMLPNQKHLNINLLGSIYLAYKLHRQTGFEQHYDLENYEVSQEELDDFGYQLLQKLDELGND